jgi:hypothetical protein
MTEAEQRLPGILLTKDRAFSARLSTRCVPLPTLYLFSFCKNESKEKEAQ